MEKGTHWLTFIWTYFYLLHFSEAQQRNKIHNSSLWLPDFNKNLVSSMGYLRKPHLSDDDVILSFWLLETLVGIGHIPREQSSHSQCHCFPGTLLFQPHPCSGIQGYRRVCSRACVPEHKGLQVGDRIDPLHTYKQQKYKLDWATRDKVEETPGYAREANISLRVVFFKKAAFKLRPDICRFPCYLGISKK